jgi:hypothetical protein
VVNDSGIAKAPYIGSKNLYKFKYKAKVYGLTSSKGKVALANLDIISASVDNSKDFAADLADNSYNEAQVGVYAKNTLSSTKPTAAGTLSVTIKNPADGLVHAVTTAISSKDDTPQATFTYVADNRLFAIGTVDFDNVGDKRPINNIYGTGYIPMDVCGKNVTIDKNQFVSGFDGKLVTRFSSDGNITAHGSASALVYLCAVDQYRTDSAPFTTLSATCTNSAYTINIDSNHIAHVLGDTSKVKSGDVITLTGITANGLVESVNVILK